MTKYDKSAWIMDYAWIMLGLSWIMLAALIKKLQVPRDVLVNVPI